jgi:CDGSH-type Zn-finger protein
VSKSKKQHRTLRQEILNAESFLPINMRSSKKQPYNQRRIRVIKDGPYIVTGGIPLTVNTVVLDDKGLPYEWKAGKNYHVGNIYELCRCGKSKTLPFCDNTHAQIGFDGTETASFQPFLSEAAVFEGPELTLADLPKLCVHAGFCDRMGGTWALTQYSDTPEARRIAIEQAGNCPSGRLVVSDKDGNEIEPEYEPSIVLVEDPNKGISGPLWIRGCIPIESAEGVTYEIRNRVALCRCGKSTNKPFCDGEHLNK